MKYHYKTPEEAKENLERLKNQNPKVHPFRNRTFLMIMADTLLIVLIILILHYTGYLFNDRVDSGEEASLDPLRISFTAAGLSDINEEPFFYLKVKNEGEESMLFPAPEGPFSLMESELLIFAKGSAIPEEEEETSALFSFDLRPESRRIMPGETEVYRFHPAWPPGKGKGYGSFTFLFKIRLKESTIRLRLR